ncbi:MAG TPA: hypothetical protein VMD53_18095 [Rhizomicrobium sp.]|nr:hypothetical protein [Rhizomicrobium sp.]
MASTPRPAKIVIGGLLLCVPALLAALALPRFMQGMRAEPFHRVIESAELGEHLPAETYRAAADALAGAPDEDGESLYERAQVLALSADNNSTTLLQARALTVQALRAEPTSPGAWLLLCQIDARQSSAAASRCLADAFAVAPYDWYTAERRMLLTASEWSYLDERARDKAVSVVLPMWTVVWPINNATLRGTLYELSFTKNGRQLLRAGFAGHRDDLRDFNRYIIEENGHDR